MVEKKIKAPFVEITDGVIIPSGWFKLRKTVRFLYLTFFYIGLISILISITTPMIFLFTFLIFIFALLTLTTSNPCLEFDQNTGKVVIWSNSLRRKKLCENSFNEVLFTVGITDYEDSESNYNMTIKVKNKKNYKFTLFNFEELRPNIIEQLDIDKIIAERYVAKIAEFLRAYLAGENLAFPEIGIESKDSLKQH